MNAAARMRDVLDAAEALLRNCDCGSSCEKCLRTYENKFNHEKLNRYDALTLLSYILNGSIPDLAESRKKELLEAVRAGLHLIDPSAILELLNNNELRINRNSVRARIILRPSLKIGEDSLLRSTFGAFMLLEFTDYQVIHSLPGVVNRILDATESPANGS